MKNPTAAKQRCMGFREVTRLAVPSQVCPLCTHVKEQGSDLRCTKGSFYVRANSSCNEFDARDKVAIGPTDV